MNKLVGGILKLALLLLILLGAPTNVLAAQAEQLSEPGQAQRSFRAALQAVLEDARAVMTAPFRMDRQEALAAGGALAIVGGLFAADRSIRTIVLHNPRSSGRDVADGFNSFGSPAGLAGLNAGVIAIGAVRESSGGDSRVTDAGLLALEAEVFAVAATVALKQMIGRARPGSEQGMTSFRPFAGNEGTSSRQKSAFQFRPFGGGGAFPSSHTAASFAVATVFAERFEAPVGWLAYGLATAVAGSRLYVDEHFASDVVAGGLLGWGLGTFLSKRHQGPGEGWELKPLATPDGVHGVTISKRF